MAESTTGKVFVWALGAVWLLSGLVPVAAREGLRERPVESIGVLHVLQEDDFTTGATKRLFFLQTTPGAQLLRLEFEVEPAHDLRTGDRVRVRGHARGQRIRIDKDRPDGIETLTSAATVNGSRSSVVMVVDFQNATVSCSDASIDAVLYSGAQSVDGLYQESSFGAISFPGDVDGDGQPDVFRVSIDAQTGDACDASGWASAADSAAVASGVDLSGYQHRIYVLPNNVSCGWAGLANVGCFGTCRSWIKRCDLPDVFAHELGHNVGLSHASTDTDNDGILDCEYCDQSDVMGIGGVGWRQFNGPHKEQMGWLPAGQIVEVSLGGTQNYTLSPLTTDPAGAPYPQLLKVYRPGTDDYYYVSYRTRTGYDQSLGAAYADRANVHHFSGSNFTNTKFVTALQDGGDAQDANLGLTISQLSHDALSVTLQLDAPGACADPDGDGVCSDVDNCPDASNDDQADADGDGVGDACDACDDPDADEVCSDVDNCPATSNGDQADGDADGVGDACDASSDSLRVPRRRRAPVGSRPVRSPV